MRSTVVKTFKGEVSGVLKSLLGLFFDPAGHDFKKAGITLKLPDGRPLTVYLSLDIVVADEAALHGLYTCKGSSGLKPCMLCQNIFNTQINRHIVESDVSGWSQYHDCTDTGKLELHTRATIDAIYRRLEAGLEYTRNGTFTGAYKELQVRLGWNYTPGSVMLCARARALCHPVDVAVHDWMHVCFVGGVFNVHMGYLMTEIKHLGVTYAMLNEYVSQWKWPATLASKLANPGGALASKRASSSWEAGSLKATASEAVSMMPILAHFFERLQFNTANADLKQHLGCMLLLVRVVELIMLSSRRRVDPDELQIASNMYLAKYKSLYGGLAMTTKFHVVLHFPIYLRNFKYLPNCWVLERKHKQPKRFSNEMRNTSGSWEASVAREVTNRHLAAFSSIRRCRTATLLEPVTNAPPPMLETLVAELGGAVEVWTSRSARINECERIGKGDMVLLHAEHGSRVVGEVVFIASVAVDELHTVICQVQLLEMSSLAGPRATKWRRSEALQIVDAGQVECAVVWAGEGSTITVLSPPVV